MPFRLSFQTCSTLLLMAAVYQSVYAYRIKMTKPGCEPAKGVSCELRVPDRKNLASTVDVYYSASTGLILVIARTELDSSDIARLFSKTYFTQEEEWVLSEDLRKNLGAPKGFKVSKGKYEFTRTRTGFRIWFGRPVK